LHKALNPGGIGKVIGAIVGLVQQIFQRVELKPVGALL